MKRIFVVIVVSFGLITYGVASAAMTSTNYRINWDTLGSGGLDTGTSVSYQLFGTLGNIGIGVGTSASYSLRSGYQQTGLDPLQFSFNLSTNSCALGELTASAINACLVTLTVTTNATNGYVTTVINNSGGLQTSEGDNVDAISGSTLTAGTEGYGISTENANADISQFSGGSITSGNCTTDLAGPLSSFSPLSTTQQSIVETSTTATNEATDVCIAAAIQVITVGGEYTDLITFVATGYY